MQKQGNCDALQMVESMEIDQHGRMWVVDLGRTAVLDEPNSNDKCPAKLVIFDVTDKNYKILSTYIFPENVVNRTTNLLKDINVTCTSQTDCFAYIADVAGAKLIVFDARNQNSWSVSHKSMQPDESKSTAINDGKKVDVNFGIAGSALSPRSKNFATFYYTAIASTAIYAVSTAILNTPGTNRVLTDDQVLSLYNRTGQSDGWAMDNQGTLYFGNLPESAVYTAKTTENPPKVQSEMRKKESKKELSWTDTFGFDNEGSLALVSSKFHQWEAKELNPNKANFRVVRFRTNTKAYSA